MTPTREEGAAVTQPEKISRDDIEEKFRQLTGDVDDKADEAKSTAITIGAVVAVAVILGVFFFGRSRGQKKTTVLEVRRFLMARRSKGPGGRRRRGLFATLERLGINRGIFGGSRGWFYVGTGLWTLRTVRRKAQRNVEIVLSEELQPGQRVVIANGRATLDPAAGPATGPASGSRRRRRRA